MGHSLPIRVALAWILTGAGTSAITAEEPFIPLFDGTSLESWRHQDSYEVNWPIESGELVVGPGKGSLFTRQHFQDFRLHVEFAIPKSSAAAEGQSRGNSGLYLQGRYEVQILDSYGKPELAKNDCASIYRFKAPDQNLAKPPGEWQTYDIVFRAPRFGEDGRRTEHPRISVWWNGVLVHDQVDITVPYTGAGRFGDPKDPGPIQLQDHGNAVRFRNIWIQPIEDRVEPDWLDLPVRGIGPAGMSGRVAAVAAFPGDPNHIWVGAATGGLWRSRDGGLTFEPVFDEQPVASIGAIAIDPSDPDVVWVGTGEGNLRNSASVGNGVYVTRDGGRSFTHLGLDGTEHIHRIVLHPEKRGTVWVAATGTAWGENEERGVFKTEDSGRTWRRVLFVDAATAASDLALNPSNPDRLFATMWTVRREPHFFRSGGSGSGIFRSDDGGESWQRLGAKEGLPEGELGRSAVAFAPSNPEIVYALVEAKESALLRSDDGGHRFQTVNAAPNIAPRPFYFCDIRVDPKDPNRVYNLHGEVDVSNDGGKTFETLLAFYPVHPDHHALWIHPDDGRFLIDANDGGIAISRDHGRTWRFATTLPLAQFYHLSVDDDRPYHVYGGLQDNGSWRGPSAVWENGGIRNHHWQEVGFGDGFTTLPHPLDSQVGYAMSQNGYLHRWSLHTGERKDIRPVHPNGTKLRFNWNAALELDPFRADGLYFGSQFVHYSPDRGESWRILSPDLTTNRPEWQRQAESGGLTIDVTGAEDHTTILTIAPSPLQPGVIWTGTDDGRLHLTRDGGETWESLEGRLPGVPENTWIPHIEASKHDPAGAFVVLDDHRRANGETYLFHTGDFGQTWRSLVTGELSGYAHVIEQDPVDKGLLFLGTELGLFVTLDGGKQWWKYHSGFPTAGVRALIVHPREHDLVIGTHGRAAWIIDDISPWREMDAETLSRPLALLPIAPALQYTIRQTDASRFPGHTEFRGDNEAYGARIDFTASFADMGSTEKVRIEIVDEAGERVRELEVPVKNGLNRVVWDLRREPFQEPRGEEGRGGVEVSAGTYTVSVSLRGVSLKGALQVFPDPRVTIASSDRAAKWDAILEVGELQARVSEAIDRLRDTREDLEHILSKLEARSPLPDERVREAKSLIERTRTLESVLSRPDDAKGIERRDWTRMEILRVVGSLTSSWEAPTEAQLLELGRLRRRVSDDVARVDAFLAEELDAFRAAIRKAGIELLPKGDPDVSGG
ncbi:MAG: DUF1080 domain-containing protein [Planctomycetota bacterium]